MGTRPLPDGHRSCPPPARLALSIFLALSALLASAALGCGGDDAPTVDASIDADVDAGSDGSAGDGPTPPAPPAEAALPTLTPCRDGWREVAHPDGYTACEPWPEAGHQACTGASAHFPGTAGCATVGTACPTDGLPGGLPAGSTVHWVSAGAGGTGSRTDPYGTIAEAIAVAADGDIVAVGIGTYDESVGIPRGVTIWGACAAETVIATSTPGPTAVIYGLAPETTIRNVTLGRSLRPGIEVAGPGRRLEVRDVVVDGVSDIGIRIRAGATLDGQRVVVRDVRATGGESRGVIVTDGGTFTGSQVNVLRAPQVGLLAAGRGTTITASDIALSQSLEATVSGLGVFAGGGASIELTGAVIEANEGAGGYATEANTTVTLLDSVIRGNVPSASGVFGRGFNFESGAEGIIRRSIVSGNRDVALYVKGSPLTIEDSVVRQTESELRDRRGGFGFEIREAGSLTGRRLVVADSRGAGILSALGTTLTLEDAHLLRTRGQEVDNARGLGLQLETDVTAELDRLFLDGHHGVAFGVYRANVVARDIIVQNTEGDANTSLFGRAFSVEGGVLMLSRARLSNNREVGFFVAEAETTIEDLHVSAMREEEATGAYGRAINYQFGATGTLRRVLIEDGVEAGVAAVAESGQVSFEDLVIRRIRGQACTSPSCTGAFFGVGLLANTFSPVSVTGFTIEDCDVCGVQLANDGAIDLSSGAIRRNDIGACIQVDGYDIGRLSEDVSYEDNGSNLDSTTLPVPPVPEVAD